MRLQAILMTGVILFTVIPTVNAGQFGKAYLSIGGNEPINKFGAIVTTGIDLSVGYGIIPKSISTGDIEFVGRIKYENFAAHLDNSTPDISFLHFGLDLKFNLRNNHLDSDTKGTNFYLLLGGGLSSVKWSSYQEDENTIESISENSPFISPGIGAEFGSRSILPYLEMRYTMVSGNRIGDYQSIGVSFGIKI